MQKQIEITENAQNHIADIIKKDNAKYFRITVLGGGCAGFQYKFNIDKIKNAKINENSNDYQKYLNLARIKIVNDLYNTYDSYLNNKYKVEINYQALDTVKNYFN